MKRDIPSFKDIRLEGANRTKQVPRCRSCRRVCIPHKSGACRTCRAGMPPEEKPAKKACKKAKEAEGDE